MTLIGSAPAGSEQPQQTLPPPAAACRRLCPRPALLFPSCSACQGIKQYDPRVVDCLLDLTYKAASDILADAEVRRWCGA